MSARAPEAGPLAGRLRFIDSLRGLSALAMIVVNALEPFRAIPGWAKHAPGDGYTFVDLIAPTFVFVMGLSYDLSFERRRERDGVGRAVRHVLSRYGVLFFFGSLGTLLLLALGQGLEWNVFQALGVSGIVALPFIFIRVRAARLLCALAVMASYQTALWLGLRPVLEGNEFLRNVLHAVALSALLVIGSSLSRRARGSGKGALWMFLCAGAAVTALALALWPAIAPNRPFASLTYLLLSLGLSLLLAGVLFLVQQTIGLGLSALEIPGRNALVLFMVSSVLTLVLHGVVAEGAPLLRVLLGTAGVLLPCVLLAVVLDWRKIYVKL